MSSIAARYSPPCKRGTDRRTSLPGRLGAQICQRKELVATVQMTAYKRWKWFCIPCSPLRFPCSSTAIHHLQERVNPIGSSMSGQLTPTLYTILDDLPSWNAALVGQVLSDAQIGLTGRLQDKVKSPVVGLRCNGKSSWHEWSQSRVSACT